LLMPAPENTVIDNKWPTILSNYFKSYLDALTSS